MALSKLRGWLHRLFATPPSAPIGQVADEQQVDKEEDAGQFVAYDEMLLERSRTANRSTCSRPRYT